MIELFSVPINKGRVEENTLITHKLFNSLQNEEFSLEFQPQVSCISGKTVGIEALLRWTTSDKKEYLLINSYQFWSRPV